MIVRDYFGCTWDVPRTFAEPGHRALTREWRFRGGNRKDYSALMKTWDFGSTEYLEPLNGIVLRSMHLKVPVGQGEWSLLPGATSTLWRLVYPPVMPQAAYLKYYDTNPTKWGAVELNRTFDLDAGVAVYALRSKAQNLTVQNGALVPITKDQGLLKPWVGICLPPYQYGKDWYSYVLILPTSPAWLKETGTPTGMDKPEDRRPSLRRAKLDASGLPGTWETVDEFPGNALQQELMNATVRGDLEELVLIRQLEGVLMMAAGSFGDWWVYSDQIIRSYCPVGKMRFYAQGHQAAFLPCQQFIHGREVTDQTGQKFVYYDGTVTMKTPPPVDADLDLKHLAVSMKATQGRARAGASVTAIADTDSTDSPTKLTRFGAKLEAKDSAHTPILYLLQEVYPASFTKLDRSPQRVPLIAVEVDRKENEHGHVRGATCKITVAAGVAMPAFRGNEEVSVYAGTIDADGSSTESYVLFTGRVVNPEEILEASPLAFPREIELRDDTFRLDKKKCRTRIGDVSGWQWTRAWRHSLNAFGVPDDRIRINGLMAAEGGLDDSFTLPGGDTTAEAQKDALTLEGETSFAPTAKTAALKWLDYLCQARGDWIWRVEPDGVYHVLSRPTYQNDIPAFVLQNSPADSDDRIRRFRHTRDLDEFVNEIEIIGAVAESPGAGDEGEDASLDLSIDPQSAIWRDERSQKDPTYRFYVGDVWEEVVEDRNIADPEAEAKKRGAKAELSSDVITWDTRGKPLFPGMHVRCEMAGTDIPVGSVFRLTAESRTLAAAENDITHRATYTGVLESIPVL